MYTYRLHCGKTLIFFIEWIVTITIDEYFAQLNCRYVRAIRETPQSSHSDGDFLKAFHGEGFNSGICLDLTIESDLAAAVNFSACEIRIAQDYNSLMASKKSPSSEVCGSIVASGSVNIIFDGWCIPFVGGVVSFCREHFSAFEMWAVIIRVLLRVGGLHLSLRGTICALETYAY